HGRAACRGGLAARQRPPTEPAAARLRGGEGDRSRRLCLLEFVYRARRAERRRDALAGAPRPHPRLCPDGAAIARMGLGGGRRRGAAAVADSKNAAPAATARFLRRTCAPVGAGV